MDHRPYEDWLLNDERLTPEQDRDLRVHLRTCADCNALARSNLAMRAAPVVAPREGFALRVQERLAAQRVVQRRRTFIGLFLLIAAGLVGLIWLFLPYFSYLALPPAQLSNLWISNLVFLALTVRAWGALGETLLIVLGSLVPTYVWVLSLLILGGMGSLWIFSFRRVGKFAQTAA